MIKKVKTIVKKGIAAGHTATGLLDKKYIKEDIECEWPPVFILGVPRSGTTLLYQLMMNYFEFAYFPNIANTFYMAPITAMKFGKKWCKPYESSFESHYGYEAGCMAPSEAGNIWNRWFPQEKRDGFNYTPAGYLNQKNRRDVYNLIANTEQVFGAPYLTKNLKNGVRLRALKEIFPDALFLHITRDPVDSALSILKIRRQEKRAWFSVMPKEMEEIENLPEIEQVCSQVYYIDENINNDIRMFFSKQYYQFTYDFLCQKPKILIENIISFFTENNFSPKIRNDNIPSVFKKSKPRVNGIITETEIETVREITARIFKNNKL